MSEEQKQDGLQACQLGNVVEVAFSFDTTGSMSPCIADVRKQLKELIVQMSADIPGLRIAIMAHGDYCDGPNCLYTLDFTEDHDAIIKFVEEVPNTMGGDVDECYELILHKARELSWTGKGAFVLIGDAAPHAPDYPDNTDHLDWLEELQELCGITKVYAMQCMRGRIGSNNKFWDKVAETAGTKLLQLNDFEESAATLGAVAYAASGDKGLMESYRGCVTRCCAMSADMVENFDAIERSMDDDEEE